MKIITQPTTEPVTLAEVKDQLGINDATLDIVLARRIKGARKWVEDYCERALITQTIEFRLDFFPDLIVVPMPEAISVTHIKYVDGSGVVQTVSSADYVLDAYKNLIRPAYGLQWPTPREEINAVRVQYVAGYGATATAVPEPIIDCIINIIGHWTNYQGALQGGSTLTQVPGAIRKILDNYRTRFI